MCETLNTVSSLSGLPCYFRANSIAFLETRSKPFQDQQLFDGVFFSVHHTFCGVYLVQIYYKYAVFFPKNQIVHQQHFPAPQIYDTKPSQNS